MKEIEKGKIGDRQGEAVSGWWRRQREQVAPGYVSWLLFSCMKRHHDQGNLGKQVFNLGAYGSRWYRVHYQYGGEHGNT